MLQPPIKIKCPSGTTHTLEEAKICQHCHELFPGPVLDALLGNREHQKKEREKPTFGIATLVSNCLRQGYYKLTEEQILELEKLWVFSRGHAIHHFVTRTLKDEEKELFVKKEFPQFDVIGFVDAVHDGVVYEFKTTASIPDVPQTAHVLQAQAYFSMLPEPIKSTIKAIKIVYLSMHKIKAFDVPLRDITPFLEARGTQLMLALKKKLPPEKEVSWLCKYCDFYETCFGKKIDFID
ncbi:MAG: Dna2/Cas4 domain-containing protein [Candidatus Nanoarchaeia archaeon]